MARITVEDCLERVGDDNRFNLIHLTVQRIRQHRQGEPFLVKGKNKEIVMTLREIAAGKVTLENIDDLQSVQGTGANVNQTDLETVNSQDV
jgi:DNA-directed RNA polymerase subunit omega